MIIRVVGLVLCIVLFTGTITAQDFAEINSKIDAEQSRIDKLDGKTDSSYNLNMSVPTQRAKNIYFKGIDEIQKKLSVSKLQKTEISNLYAEIYYFLEGINKSNITHLSFGEQYLQMANVLIENKDVKKEQEYLKNHIHLALKGINFFIKREYAKSFLLFAASVKPYDVLQQYRSYEGEKYFLEVLEEVAKNDPNAIKQYFGTTHNIYYTLKNSSSPYIKKLLDIYAEFGRGSESYTNIELIYNHGLSLENSEKLISNKTGWIKKLMELRRKTDFYGKYSVDDQLKFECTQIIIKVNLLHDETNEKVRFFAVNQFNSEELYNIIVYSKDEIFTSSFIGCFNRLMQRRNDSSLYKLFEKTNFNRFRTFFQMCAGYNKMNEVFRTMNAAEKDIILNKIVENLDKTGGNLTAAVEVADIYSSLLDTTIQNKIAEKISKELKRCVIAADEYGIKVYGLLYKLCGKNPASLVGTSVNFNLPAMEKVEAPFLFPDGKHIQLHVFYDDEDGDAAFKSFIAQFKADKNYLVTDALDHIKIESKTGKKILLYCNKPKVDGSADALQKMFEKQKRFPDLIVHRGHSYYLNQTIDLLTNNIKVAILGSCGGYNNITNVLENASEAHIVSSKQIGSWTVNNPLCKEICEQLRNGNGELDWKKLWLSMDKKMKGNTRWPDYVPPFKNLGVKFVKTFETI